MRARETLLVDAAVMVDRRDAADSEGAVYAIGNDMCVITKDSEGALWKGYKTWICNRDADTWKIRMEYVN